MNATARVAENSARDRKIGLRAADGVCPNECAARRIFGVINVGRARARAACDTCARVEINCLIEKSADKNFAAFRSRNANALLRRRASEIKSPLVISVLVVFGNERIGVSDTG